MPKTQGENLLTFPATPTVTVEVVTPEMASKWLEKNTANRNLKPGKISQYARDMAAGNWKLTAEPIKFSLNGRLLDGQNRLWAVMEAEVPVALFVARGLPEDTQAYMDSGVSRSAGDTLTMRGEANAQRLAATARIASIVERGVLFRDRANWAISKPEIYEWIDANPSIRRSVGYVGSGEPGKVALPPSTKAYCHFRFSRLDVDAADEFFSSLGSLINIPAGSAIHALSSRLRQLEQKRVKVELPDQLSVTFRAWNAYRAGRQMAVIPLASNRGQKQLPELD
jgi:hypothetical protein